MAKGRDLLVMESAAPLGLGLLLLRTQRLRTGLTCFAPPALVGRFVGTSQYCRQIEPVFFECGGGASAFEDFTPGSNFCFDSNPYAVKARALLSHSKGLRTRIARNLAANRGSKDSVNQGIWRGKL
jgi:hypothetical protein